MSKFLIRKTARGVKFDLKASNGQVILSSEVYNTYAAALKGITSVRLNAENADVEDHTDAHYQSQTNPKFELYQDKASQYRFRLKARNGKIIGVSEGYTGKAGCLNGIESVRHNAPLATIEEKE